MRSTAPHSRLLLDCTALRQQRHRAFTLIQLITAIGIIGVLVGLLVPALRHSMATSRKTRCASQLRQIHLAMTSYASDHNGRFTPYYIRPVGYAQRYWVALLRPYFALPVTTQWSDNDPSEVYRCPSDNRSTGFYPNTSTYGAYGLGGLNGPGWGIWGYAGTPRPTAWSAGLPLVSVTSPSRTVMLLEHDQLFATNPEQLRASQDAFRHQGRINVIYFDGHMDALKKEQIPDHTDIFWRTDGNPNTDPL